MEFLGTEPNDRCALFALFGVEGLVPLPSTASVGDGISQYPKLV
jgi:hypothetical protein